MKHDACSVLNYIDLLSTRLQSLGCRLQSNGFPILEPDWFLQSEPQHIVTYQKRNARYITDRTCTLLCFYSPDVNIYSRFDNIEQELPIYREFMGVIAPDLTVTSDMDVEWQEAIILVNQLFIATLGIQGIKIVENLRIGGEESIECLNNFPPGVPCATSTLGCQRTTSLADTRFTEKLLAIRPSIVYLYGKEDTIMEHQLELTGTPYLRFPDAHHELKRYYARVNHDSSFANSLA